MAEEVETVWFQHRFNDSVHEVANGSASHLRCLREQTQVDVEAGEVPEPVFERMSASEVKRYKDSPEKYPGFFAPRGPRPSKGTTVVVQNGEGPSDEAIQARVDAAAKAAAEAAVAQFAAQLNELDAASKTDQQGAVDAAAKTDTKGK